MPATFEHTEYTTTQFTTYNKKNNRQVLTAKNGDTLIATATVNLKNLSSTSGCIGFFICDSDGNKLYIENLEPLEINTRKITFPWTVNTDKIQIEQNEKYFCYFTIYGESFYNSEEVWIEL